MAERKVIEVDLTRCEGHGKCYRIAPELFDPFDDHGHAAWIGEPIDQADKKGVALGDRVILECPESALSWSTANFVEGSHS
jgi:ferredoxin